MFTIRVKIVKVTSIRNKIFCNNSFMYAIILKYYFMYLSAYVQNSGRLVLDGNV